MIAMIVQTILFLVTLSAANAFHVNILCKSYVNRAVSRHELHTSRKDTNVVSTEDFDNNSSLLLSVGSGNHEIHLKNENGLLSSRRRFMYLIPFAAGAISTMPEEVCADVSDGNALPEGAQQFARTIKLKKDIQVRVIIVLEDKYMARPPM